MASVGCVLRALAGLTIGVVLAGCGGAAKPHAVTTPVPLTGCDRWASPDGDDAAAGTAAAPLRNAQALADALRPGQTGCLRSGSYPAGEGGYAALIRQDGVTLRGEPGATLAGVVYVPRGADGVTLADLAIHDNGASDQITVQVDARGTTLERLDITNGARKTCVILGSLIGYGTARDTVIRDSVLHDCGSRADKLFDHAIYVSNAERTRIVGNVLADPAGYGVHLYPDAQDSLVRGNVITGGGGGIIVGGEDGRASAGNVVTGNLITGTRVDYDLAAYWPQRPGEGNVVRGNCLGAGRGVDPELGAAASGNVRCAALRGG